MNPRHMHVNWSSDGPSNVCFLTIEFAYVIAFNTHYMPIYFSMLIMSHRSMKGKWLQLPAHVKYFRLTLFNLLLQTEETAKSLE